MKNTGLRCPVCQSGTLDHPTHTKCYSCCNLFRDIDAWASNPERLKFDMLDSDIPLQESRTVKTAKSDYALITRSSGRVRNPHGRIDWDDKGRWRWWE